MVLSGIKKAKPNRRMSPVKRQAIQVTNLRSVKQYETKYVTMDFAASSPNSQSTQPNMNGINGSAPDEMNGIAELSSLFDLLDLEGNGDLDFAEFKVGLTSIGATFSHDEATALFRAIDAENDQYINRESFREWISKEAASAELGAI